MKKIKTLLTIGFVMLLPMSMNAQSCVDKLKKANKLKSAGLASKDIDKLRQAVYMFRQVSQCDPDLRSNCQKEVNSINNVIKSLKPDLTVSSNEVRIPYQGGARQIDVISSGKWYIAGESAWCKTNVFDGRSFAIECLEANNSTRDKTTLLSVKSGSINKTIRVIQEARPEYLEVSAESLSFPASGASEIVSVETNVNWDVASTPSWCKVQKTKDGINITVNPNDRNLERSDKIIIHLPSNNKVVIRINQGAGDEKLILSKNNLTFGANGGEQCIKVYTDADNWFVGDYPTWMNVQRIGNDSISIRCASNDPTGLERSGSVQIKTDRQTVGVMVEQAPLMVKDLIFPDSKLVGGRNISIGVSASYFLPFVGASAGGDYVGSIVDYGLGTSSENASYKSAMGFSVGFFADMRLYKNIYLIAGANFSMMKYKNQFNQGTTYIMPRSAYEYMKGEVQNSYTEEYTHTMIEVPILASYRFKTGKVSHVQLNLGPVLNFGISAKMKLSGNTDSETMKIYNSSTHQLVSNANYLKHTAVNADFNLYQPCVLWTEMYTTGNDAPVDHHDEFQESPLNRVNFGLRAGVAYEWAGISFGIYYTQMLSNMANKNYWENDRWTILNNSDVTMKGYKHRLNYLEMKLAYTLRYNNKNKK